MNQTVRGLIIFVSVLVTVVFWMPLSNEPRLGPNGGTMTDTYFGLFRYATMHAVMKEPDFSMNWSVDPKRLVFTIAVTVAFWLVILTILRRAKRSASNRTET